MCIPTYLLPSICTHVYPEDEWTLKILNFTFFFQEELDLSAPNKTAMLSLPQEKKWQIYCSQKGSLGCDTGLSNDPEFYIDSITQLSGLDYSGKLWHKFNLSFFQWIIFLSKYVKTWFNGPSYVIQICANLRKIARGHGASTASKLLWGHNPTVLWQG